jgi:DNA-binding NtrC family response regulator
MELLNNYHYPGNIRELKNIVASSYYTTVGTVISPNELPVEVRSDQIFDGSKHDSIAATRLYSEIIKGTGTFVSVVKGPFLQHQFGTPIVKGVIRRALIESGGKYKEAFARLGISSSKYASTMQFLKRNKCYLDFRQFRNK